MSITPKLFTTVATIGGVGIGVPLILWKTNFLGISGSQPAIKTIVKQLPKTVTTSANAGRGKCNVEKLSDKNESFLLSQKQGGKFYVEALCENTGVNSGAGALSSAWTGLFPSELLTNGENLSIEEKIDLETQDLTTGETIRTIFKGKGMKKTVTGTWGEKIVKGDQPITPVSFENSDTKNKLYLIFY